MKSDKLMSYKGFSGTAEVSVEDNVLFGKIVFINDLITYEATNLNDLRVAFEEAVDDYVETCELIRRAPHKPMSGSFNVRLGEELHRRAALYSLNNDFTLNELVKCAVTDKLEESTHKMTLHVEVNNKISVSQEFDQTPYGGVNSFEFMPRSSNTSRHKPEYCH